MTFTPATQYAFQSVMFALLAIAAAVAGTIDAAPDVIQGGFAGAALVFSVTSLITTIATLFASDKEIDAQKRKTK